MGRDFVFFLREEWIVAMSCFLLHLLNILESRVRGSIYFFPFFFRVNDNKINDFSSFPITERDRTKKNPSI